MKITEKKTFRKDPRKKFLQFDQISESFAFSLPFFQTLIDFLVESIFKFNFLKWLFSQHYGILSQN